MELFKLLRDWRRISEGFVRSRAGVFGYRVLGIKYFFFWDEILININDGGLERSTIDGLFANV